MSRLYLNEKASRARLKEATAAREDRRDIVKALSWGQVSRRELLKLGLFTGAGLLAPIRGLNPFVSSAYGSDDLGIPSSPLFGVQPFTQPMLRFDLLPRAPMSPTTLNPAPTKEANTAPQLLDPDLVGGARDQYGPIEGRLLRFTLDADAAVPDPATLRQARLAAARARPGAAMFANRLQKNLKRLSAWARREDVSCFRIYDADMPEYAFAIDLYGNAERHACVQEYAAPATIAVEAARARRDEVLSALPDVLALPTERIHLKTRRRQRAGAQYERAEGEGVFHEVREGRHRFLVNFEDYLDTGLFLDHRLTRQRLGALAAGRRFLNLFAYTGTATVHVAGGGAVASTTVDMSRTYLDWGKRNLALNGLAGAAHGFVQADCLEWLREDLQEQRRPYGLIFLDPPTHSRSKRMSRDFDVQRDHVELLQLVARLLEPDGTIVFSNNFQRFRFDAAALPELEIRDITRETIPPDFARNPRIHHCFLVNRRG